MDTLPTQPAKTYHILDTETSSLRGGVVEIAWLEIDSDLNVLSEFLARVNPERPIDPGAQAIHGISDEDVRDKPTLAQHVEACGLAMPISVIGHNVAFDVRMIETTIAVRRSLCTLDLARTYVKGTTNCKLETLQRELNLSKQDSHTALGDVRSVLDLLKYILPLTGVDLETLFERQYKPRILAVMPYGMHKGKPMLQVPKPYREWLLQQDTDKNLKYTLEKLRNL